jgi:hypothetical protein
MKRIGPFLKAIWTRVVLRWATFFGLFVGASTCPLCGQTGCPKGVAGMGFLAGIAVIFSNLMGRSTKKTVQP